MKIKGNEDGGAAAAVLTLWLHVQQTFGKLSAKSPKFDPFCGILRQFLRQ